MCVLLRIFKTFHAILPPYTPYLFSTLLNDDITDNEKPYVICSSTFIVVEFSGIFLHTLIFFINPHMHEIFSQLYCKKRVPGEPQKEMLN